MSPIIRPRVRLLSVLKTGELCGPASPRKEPLAVSEQGLAHERALLRRKEAPRSVGSNGETVLRLKGARAFEVDVWTFNRRCRLL